jgi:hypothetical protein
MAIDVDERTDVALAGITHLQEVIGRDQNRFGESMRSRQLSRYRGSQRKLRMMISFSRYWPRNSAGRRLCTLRVPCQTLRTSLQHNIFRITSARAGLPGTRPSPTA